MNRSNVLKLVLAVVLLGGATFMFAHFLRQGDGISEQTYFYDLSEKKLFAASREALRGSHYPASRFYPDLSG